jgi:hypothetical protein
MPRGVSTLILFTGAPTSLVALLALSQRSQALYVSSAKESNPLTTHDMQYSQLSLLLRLYAAPGYTVGIRSQRAWESESGGWRPLGNDAQTEGSCLVAPLTAAALLDAEAKDKEAGRAEGIAEAIVKFSELRGITLSAEQRREILDCQDRARLNGWLRRVALASSAEDLTPRA